MGCVGLDLAGNEYSVSICAKDSSGPYNYELTTEDFRYVIHQVPYNEAAEREFVIEESFYFFPIQKSNIDQNPNLEQNNNWGGTFNPTME